MKPTGPAFGRPDDKLSEIRERPNNTAMPSLDYSFAPTAIEIIAEEKFVAAVPKALACRIDVIRGGGGVAAHGTRSDRATSLFPQFQPQFGELIHAACKRFINQV